MAEAFGSTVNPEMGAAQTQDPTAAGSPAEHENIIFQTEAQPLSKNQLKKQLKRKAWEESAADRKAYKKQKRKEVIERKRAERSEIAAAAVAEGKNPKAVLDEIFGVKNPRKTGPTGANPRKYVPVTIILDCDFEQYMREGELVSLAGQITRSYSQNRAGGYQIHMLVSSWGGKLKERFETTLKGDHLHWKGIKFVDGDFVEAGKVADELMREEKCGEVIGVLQSSAVKQEDDEAHMENQAAMKSATSAVINGLGQSESSIVYLTADSPNTLDRLEPHTSYVIGGLVDRNREKFICFNRAKEKGVRHAKLPIGEYMQMASRQVLATNHVVEIMSKWLETGDWGKAFMAVIPKRKGGVLKSSRETGDQHETAWENGNKKEASDKISDHVDSNDNEERESYVSDTQVAAGSTIASNEVVDPTAIPDIEDLVDRK